MNLQLKGYSALDGDNFVIDIFHLGLNGTEVFGRTWGLGGGGADRVLLDLNGATLAHVGPTVDIGLSGQGRASCEGPAGPFFIP